MTKKRQFAVFDIDGTIARSSLLQLIVRELVNRGQLGVGPGIEIEKLLHDYRQRSSDDTFGSFMKKAVDIMFADMKNGLRVRDYDTAISTVLDTHVNNTYIYTRQLMETLRSKGFFLIAISGSELRAVEQFARALKFDAWLGAVKYEIVDEKLTGNVESLPHQKDLVLKAVMHKFNLDTKGSLAVGDTSSDVPMLEMVDTPIAFNPNQALFKVARDKGWMVVIERKDMVYGLNKEGEQYVLSQTNV